MTQSSFGEALTRLWPHGDEKIPGLRAAIVRDAPRVFKKYGIVTPLQIAHFMAQLSEECGAGHEVVESLTYSAKRLMEVWPGRFPTYASAVPYANNPRKLADKVYDGLRADGSDRMGNRPGTDDGFNYRGRGGSQLTGRSNYGRLGAILGIDLINNPDLVNDEKWFLEVSAADFVVMCKCLPFCNPSPGLPNGDIRSVTHHLNGGYTGLAEREAWFARWLPALRAAAPARAPVAAPAPPVDDADPTPAEVAAAEPDDAPEPVDDGILRYGRGHDSPDFEVKALQGQLVGLGYQVGSADGDFGGGTRAAVLAFQADNGLPTTGEVDQATKAALKTAPPKPISEKRATATADDLRAGGSETIAKADNLSWWGKIAATLGIGGGAAQKTGLLDTVQAATDHASTLRSVVSSVQDVGTWALSYWWVFAILAGFFGVKIARDVIKRRLSDHRDAFNLSQ